MRRLKRNDRISTINSIRSEILGFVALYQKDSISIGQAIRQIGLTAIESIDIPQAIDGNIIQACRLKQFHASIRP